MSSIFPVELESLLLEEEQVACSTASLTPTGQDKVEGHMKGNTPMVRSSDIGPEFIKMEEVMSIHIKQAKVMVPTTPPKLIKVNQTFRQDKMLILNPAAVRGSNKMQLIAVNIPGDHSMMMEIRKLVYEWKLWNIGILMAQAILGTILTIMIVGMVGGTDAV
jgi:hypothetical protein